MFYRHRLKTLETQLEKIRMTAQEAIDKANELDGKVTALAGTITKIGSETTGLLANVATLTKSVADLTAQVNAGGNVPQALADALTKVNTDLDAVTTQAKAVDDLVPDAPAPTPPSGS